MPEGDWNLSGREATFTTGTNPPAIKPFYPDQSALYTLTVVATDDSTLMPPATAGGPLSQEMTETLRLWIEQGARNKHELQCWALVNTRILSARSTRLGYRSITPDFKS